MENNNGRGIFYGVMGVATLVVAIVGATFAYFAASTSGNEGAAAANSAKVEGTLGVAQDAQYIAKDLIPASIDTVKKSFAQQADGVGNKKKCRGASAANHDGDYGMCSFYTFTVTNTSDVATQVYLSLKTNTNDFDDSFKYCVYDADGSDTTTAVKDCKTVPANTEEFVNVNLAATTGSHQYTVVLYYENKDAVDQTSTGSGKAYTGTIMASTASGENQIVGYIAG